MKKMTLSNEKGFVLLAALIACLIILAVGMIVINISTGNLIASSVTVGEKKAIAAVESGIHRELQSFNPDQSTWTVGADNYTDCSSASPSYNWRLINSGVDSNTKFAICYPVKGPNITPEDVTMCTYTETVTGKNTSYNSLAKVDIGIGVYCPSVKGATPTTYQ